MPALTRELWNTLEPLLDEALDLAEADRPAYVDNVRTESPMLARELEVLLAGESTADELFRDSPLPDFLNTSLEGQRIGSYTLERRIGRGGMGTVWLARRSDGRFEGQVAVKLLNVALMGPAGEDRFAQEGRLLARVEHPHIARLLDAGVTDAGQPYLVLEHVTGAPIDQYADSHRCSPRQRIELCLAVLAAAGAAHAALVVHRDIKPSNILVDAEGRARLLDFGIAKLLVDGHHGTVAGTLTEHAGRALTPDYAAPEIILGEPVSTATDVYSIGVLLYVLLSGRHPTSSACRTPAERIRATLDGDPPLLSIAAGHGRTEGVEEARHRAALRGATPEQLVRQYRGDLDNILAKALRKHPSERYSTVGAFADDLARALRHEPIAARPDSLAYRTRKFVRRHRAAVISAALVTISLIGATGFSLSQMLVARRERDRADEALRRSEASMQFESLLFRLIEPGGDPLTYRQLLDMGRDVLDRRYRGDPVSRIQLGVQFAQHYLREGDDSSAIAILDRAVAAADSLGDDHWRARTRCEVAFALVKNDMTDSARAQVSRARVLLRGSVNVETATANACDRSEAETLIAEAQHAPAAELLRAIVDRHVAAGDTESVGYAYALNDLTRASFMGGRPRDALDGLRHLADITRAGVFVDPRDVEVLAFNTAATLHRLGEYAAERDALQREIALLAADPDAFMLPMLPYQYGMVLHRLELNDSAAAWLETALENADALGPGGAAAAHIVLADLAGEAGRLADMRAHEEQAAALEDASTGSPAARATRAEFRIRTAAAAGDSAGLRREIALQLELLDHEPASTETLLIAPLLAASTALLDVGAFRDADRFAAQVADIATVDSLATSRSAIVGHATYLRARAALAAGDTARARSWIRDAVPALANGYRIGHSIHIHAAAIRNALGM